MYRSKIIFLLFVILIVSCDDSTGLEPVSGVEGVLTFYGTWDHDIQAAAMIALDDLDLNDPAANLITYSNIIDPGTSEAEYFIQLLPGRYYLVPVGINVDPGFFAAKIDSFLTADEIPLEIIDKDLRNNATPIEVVYQTITQVDRSIIF